MTSYNMSLTDAHYRSVAKRAAKYYLESAKSSALPLIMSSTPDAYEYRYSNLLNVANAGDAGMDWSEAGQKGSVVHSYTDIDLFAHQLHLRFDKNELATMGESLIADKRDAIIAKWVSEIDDAAFHGPKNFEGTQMVEGLIGQLTSIEDKTSAAGHDCSTKGEIWHVLKELIEDIPFAMREEGPDMILYINEKVIAEAQAPDRIYNDMVEWDFIDRQFISGGVHGRKIGQVIVTNKINAEAVDNTDGNNADTVDTLGTHGRMLLVVPDPRWVGRIVSRGFSLVGEEQTLLGTHQLYGWKGRAYFFNGDCANYTEALTF